MSGNRDSALAFFEEVMNRGHLDSIDVYIDEGFILHASGSQPDLDRGGLKTTVEDMRRDFPDLHVTVEDAIDAGDKIVTRYRMTGTHRDSGRCVDVAGIDIDRFEDGLVVEAWTVLDEFSLERQLGH